MDKPESYYSIVLYRDDGTHEMSNGNGPDEKLERMLDIARGQYDTRIAAIGDTRPLRTDRERWIEQAIHAHVNAEHPCSEFEAIYDALQSGELPTPEAKQ